MMLGLSLSLNFKNFKEKDSLMRQRCGAAGPWRAIDHESAHS